MRQLNLYLKFKMKTLRNFNPFKGYRKWRRSGGWWRATFLRSLSHLKVGVNSILMRSRSRGHGALRNSGTPAGRGSYRPRGPSPACCRHSAQSSSSGRPKPASFSGQWVWGLGPPPCRVSPGFHVRFN